MTWGAMALATAGLGSKDPASPPVLSGVLLLPASADWKWGAVCLTMDPSPPSLDLPGGQ